MDCDDESERKLEALEWGGHLLNVKREDVHKSPSGSTSKVAQILKENFPHEATCSMFCGGKKCQYCNPVNWKEEQQAIKGLYSHWYRENNRADEFQSSNLFVSRVTDNIIAISRPITEFIEKYGIIKQFQE